MIEHAHDESCFDAPDTDPTGQEEPEEPDEEPEEDEEDIEKDEPDDQEEDDEPKDSLPLCSLKEHAHGEVCYDEEGRLICGLAEHVHDESCFEEAGETQEALPLCGLEEHRHGEGCYDEEGLLICGLAEHVHDENCFDAPDEEPTEQEEPEESEGQEEDEEPEEGDEAEETDELGDPEEDNETQDGLPLCGLEEHTHGEGCYDEEGLLICEFAEHLHDESCFDASDEEPAEQEEPEESGGPEEDEEPEEDEQTEETDESGDPEEDNETQDGLPLCGLEEHAHDEGCYDKEGLLICGLAEHMHDEGCFAGTGEAEDEEEAGEEPGGSVFMLSALGEGYSLTLSFEGEGELPEGAALSVEEYLPGSEGYAARYGVLLSYLAGGEAEDQKESGGEEEALPPEGLSDSPAEEPGYARAFGIALEAEGERIEPPGPMKALLMLEDAPQEMGGALRLDEEGGAAPAEMKPGEAEEKGGLLLALEGLGDIIVFGFEGGEGEGEEATFDIWVEKRDSEDDTPLSGAKFRLLRREEQPEGEPGEGNAEDDNSYITGSDGQAQLGGLTPGNYLLEETFAPAGYLLPDSAFAFTLGQDGLLSVPEDSGARVSEDGEGLIIPGVRAEGAAPILPATGGGGIGIVTWTGTALAALACFMYSIQKRDKENKRRKEEGAPG